MVLVEEIDEDEEVAPLPPSRKSQGEGGGSAPSVPAGMTKTKTRLEKGFLDKAKEPLYPPEGSKEGHVAPETHKAHMEHDLNENMNKQMNRGADNNNGYERPDWYTKDWPKDCQYNSPGCKMDPLQASAHKSEHHRAAMRDSKRWDEATARGSKSLRLGFFGLADEDMQEVIDLLKGNDDVTELDLSHNQLNDAGVQALVAALAAGAAPNLKDLRIYKNEFGALGKTMLTQGLAVFRKKLEIKCEEPDWARLAKPSPAVEPALPTVSVGGMD
eukprot:TRINITY_DN11329_c0_g1_i1.p1 TRINITY_DN11329_c0_g1~~TRINITY_DN11329_c0_g1_i1.p1  ORF type:complete len:297 (-),score=87.14 TRINITY_DN11329_c0_g1_i1:107-922(-)